MSSVKWRPFCLSLNVLSNGVEQLIIQNKEKAINSLRPGDAYNVSWLV